MQSMQAGLAMHTQSLAIGLTEIFGIFFLKWSPTHDSWAACCLWDCVKLLADIENLKVFKWKFTETKVQCCTEHVPSSLLLMDQGRSGTSALETFFHVLKKKQLVDGSFQLQQCAAPVSTMVVILHGYATEGLIQTIEGWRTKVTSCCYQTMCNRETLCTLQKHRWVQLRFSSESDVTNVMYAGKWITVWTSRGALHPQWECVYVGGGVWFGVRV